MKKINTFSTKAIVSIITIVLIFTSLSSIILFTTPVRGACDEDNDADNDGVPDWDDYFPCDPNESRDSDRDGIGDNADTDDDNDGYTDSDETACGSDPLDNSNVPSDFDGDFIPDCVDSDDDNDGVPDNEDDFPYDPTTSHDTPISVSKQSKRSYFTNIAPVANANGPYYTTINEDIEFNGSLSYDSDGILHYSWSFGDGETGVGEIVTHRYALPGMYQITLTIIDYLGASDTDVTNASISIPNRPPSQSIILGPSIGIITIKYSYSFESSDVDNDQITYIVDWGDGSTFETGILPNNQYISKFHQWNSSGKYTITVTTSDTKSTTSSEMIVTIQDTLIVDDIAIIVLGILALIALLVILLYSKKRKKSE